MSESKRIPVETLARALGAGEGCPALERLVAAAAGELPESERADVLAHAASCAACAAELDLARGFGREPEVDEAADVEWIVGRLRGETAAASVPAATPAVAKVLPMRPRRGALSPARRALWAAAACAALAIGLSFWSVRDGRAPALPERPLVDVVRGGAVELTTALGSLAAAPDEIAWRPVAGATSYRAEILDVADRPLLAALVTAERWTLSFEERARLETFVRYRVRVVALDAGGRELAASEPAELRLEPTR